MLEDDVAGPAIEDAKRSAWDRAFEALLPLHLFTILCFSVIEPHDFWWHVRTGELIAATHAVPTVDAYSFVTAGARFVDEPWLAQVVLFELYAHVGLAAVVLVHALVITTGYALVWRLAKRDTSMGSAAIATVLAAAIGAANWGVRPQSFSFLFFGALVALMHEHARGKSRALYWTIPLFALWSNVHGGIMFGGLALAIHGIVEAAQASKRSDREFTKHTLVACALAAAACGVNPGGYRGLYDHVAAFFGGGGTGISGNSEFAPMSIHTAYGAIFFFAIGRFLWASVKARRAPSLAQSISLGVFGALSLAAIRFAPWFGLLLLSPLASAIEASRTPEEAPARSSPLRAAVVVLSVLAAFVALPFWRGHLPLPPSRRSVASSETPFAATQALCPRLASGAHVFADQGFASYLIFACPKAQVFVDTRVQLFSAETWEEYVAIESGRFDTAALLAARKVDAVMIRVDTPQAALALKATGKWTVTYLDALAVVVEPVKSQP